MLTVFGIKQCDTCRKTLRWLAANGIDHRFHDLRSDGLRAGMVREWLSKVAADELINRRSTTWRQLDEGERAYEDEAQLVALLLAHPTLIKRPVVVAGDGVTVGYKPEEWR